MPSPWCLEGRGPGPVQGRGIQEVVLERTLVTFPGAELGATGSELRWMQTPWDRAVGITSWAVLNQGPMLRPPCKQTFRPFPGARGSHWGPSSGSQGSQIQPRYKVKHGGPKHLGRGPSVRQLELAIVTCPEYRPLYPGLEASRRLSPLLPHLLGHPASLLN